MPLQRLAANNAPAAKALVLPFAQVLKRELFPQAELLRGWGSWRITAELR